MAKVAQIFEGTNQIQKVVIARELNKYKAVKGRIRTEKSKVSRRLDHGETRGKTPESRRASPNDERTATFGY